MADSTIPSPVSLHDLRLGDALALLKHGGTVDSLVPPQESSIEYLQGVIDGLCELSLKDPLTGLANRRQFHTVLERGIEVVARSGESALLLMLDIDHFKKVNDTHGHQAGDQVLQAIAKCLEGCVRPMDTVARYGGEEFAVVLPNCQVSFGAAVAERIRRAVEALSISISPLVTLHVTVSMGGAYAPEWVRSTTTLWTERADLQLYRAKSEGRNRVCLDHQQVISVSAEEKNMLFGHLALGDPAWIEAVNGDSTHSAAQKVNP
ncbi:MAG TPA: GGDEF domain-containing protein [Burkholderiaceae bacterium]|nr:GGDEF domain-containing protein [Burkholderiaceae bacterium]HPW06812.1 GGDEF domain-containing protein [Burkholderiaceae bacterium]